jgi:hypothetical protein
VVGVGVGAGGLSLSGCCGVCGGEAESEEDDGDSGNVHGGCC